MKGITGFVKLTPKTIKLTFEKEPVYKSVLQEMDCPYGEHKATLYADDDLEEYFVYCNECLIETITSYKTKAAALKAFKNGENREVQEWI